MPGRDDHFFNDLPLGKSSFSVVLEQSEQSEQPEEFVGSGRVVEDLAEKLSFAWIWGWKPLQQFIHGRSLQ